jgi:hypothetical protein
LPFARSSPSAKIGLLREQPIQGMRGEAGGTGHSWREEAILDSHFMRRKRTAGVSRLVIA